MVSGVLHITNGDLAADLLRRSSVGGRVVPWRDALHEGPVPAGASADELDRVRAQFIISARWADASFVHEVFSERDAALNDRSIDEIVLWFEHDLYDQLQFLQIMDRLADRAPRRLTLIEVGEFPGVAKFVGLAQLSPSQLASLFDHRRDVTPDMKALARDAWAAFRSADPRALEKMLTTETFALPFLQDAILRHLEEYPSTENGLGRTDRQLLEAARGDRTLRHLFNAGQRAEERAYMGDSVVRWRLRQLSDGPLPLLTGRARRLAFDGDGQEFWGQEAVLTPSGQSVLEGKDDAVRLRGLDRWLGGVHLTGREAVWRWSRSDRRLVSGGSD